MTSSRRRRSAVALLALLVPAGAACGTTTIDESADTVDEAAPTTAPDDGLDAVGRDEVLAAIGTALSGLGHQIVGDGDEDTTMARIEAGWERIRVDLEADDPVAESQIRATLEMARVAVDRNRPADADKAYALFTEVLATV